MWGNYFSSSLHVWYFSSHFLSLQIISKLSGTEMIVDFVILYLPNKQLNDRVYTMLDSHYTNHFYLKCHYLMFSSCIMNWDRCSQCCSLTQIQIVPSAFMAPRGSYSTVASAPRNIGKVKDMQSEVFHLGQGLLDVNSPWSSESLHQCSSGN